MSHLSILSSAVQCSQKDIRHDNIADLLHVKADSFEEENEDLMEEWERLIFAYIDSLFEKKDGTKSQFEYHATKAYTKYIGIDRPSGFPKLKVNL